jgi:hypothetical protein
MQIEQPLWPWPAQSGERAQLGEGAVGNHDTAFTHIEWWLRHPSQVMLPRPDDAFRIQLLRDHADRPLITFSVRMLKLGIDEPHGIVWDAAQHGSASQDAPNDGVILLLY